MRNLNEGEVNPVELAGTFAAVPGTNIVLHVAEEAERELLGAILHMSHAIGPILADARLEADHFYFDRHRLIFATAVGLYEAGVIIDEVSVWDEIAKTNPGGQPPIERHYISDLAARVSFLNPLHHAKLIQEAARWRHVVLCSHLLMSAAKKRDEEELARAEAELTVNVVRSGDSSDPAALLHEMREHLESGTVDMFPWPLRGLNDRTGGLSRGEFAVIGGWTSHGKSVFVDQMLEAVAKRGYRCHLYINEMSKKQRIARIASRQLGYRFQDISSNKLTQAEREQVLRVVGEMKFGITEAAGWSAAEIANDIRQNRWDFAVVDIMHEIHYENENDLRQIISTFNRATKQASCAILAAAHLSEHRAHQRAALPAPVLADLRGSGMIKNAADFVVFCYVKPGETETESFHPDGDGYIYIAKGRNVGTTSFPARLSPGRFQWEPLSFEDERGLLLAGGQDPDAALTDWLTGGDDQPL